MTSNNPPETIRSKDAEPLARPTQEAAPNSPNKQSLEDDGLDFVVTEAHNQDPELVGGFKASPAESLAVESPSDLMQAEAKREQRDVPDSAKHRPLIEESFPLPAPPEEDFAGLNLDRSGGVDGNTEPDQRESSLEKLSAERIKEISQRMKVETERSDYLSEEEARQLINRMDGDGSNARSGSGFDTLPIIPPKRNKEAGPRPGDLDIAVEKPKIAKRVRGVAFFAKGYIHVTGEQELREGDEMTISGREYVLRRKKLSNKTIVTIVTPIAAVLAFALGAQLSSDADIGAGRIIGVVLDQNGRPYVGGAHVQLPETGRTFETNGQGFFRSDQLDPGSYKIEFVLNGNVVATDYATVADDNITTVTLRSKVPRPPAPNQGAVGATSPAADPSPQKISPSAATATTRPGQSALKPTATARTGNPSAEAKVTLAANVDGARLALDGSVIGAGNLTYTKLKPGRHSYTVSKDGYQNVSGTIDLRAGQTGVIKVTLQKVAAEQKAARNTERDYYNSASRALESGDAQTAITDFTKALELSPSYAEAYDRRADAYRQIQNKASAYDDYLRAGDIHQSRKEHEKAFSSYQEALKLDPKNTAAYLRRGNLYLERNEAIAAIADFDQVVTLDKRNVDGYLGLGRARYNQGHFDKATKHFRDARSIDSDNPVIHQYLMLSHFGAGEIKEVQKDYDKFLKCATADQVRQMRADSRFAPVLRVIE